MKIAVHDYSGHLFQSELSRELARRGHDVVHEFSAQWVTGHGRLERVPGDPAGLHFRAVNARCAVNKYDPFARVRFELSYARAWQEQLERSSFDVVVACNVPMLSLHAMRSYFARRRQPWVLWHQDMYSLGVSAEAARRLPSAVASGVRRAAIAMERSQVRDAARVVAIGGAFIDKYAEWGLTTDHVDVVPNWAPLDDVVPGPRDNAWSRAHGLARGGVRLLYAGTLGRKHNPLLLLDLLDEARSRGLDATLTVCSQGVGADELAAAALGRRDVRILGFQPISVFSEVLASSDVMVALLEPDAAAFSIPSKILSYMSAGRPTIALVPEDNPAADDVHDAGGFVAPPTVTGARAAGGWLADVAAQSCLLDTLGGAARRLAEERFAIGPIADRFEASLTRAVEPGRTVTPIPRRMSRAPLSRVGGAA